MKQSFVVNSSFFCHFFHSRISVHIVCFSSLYKTIFRFDTFARYTLYFDGIKLIILHQKYNLIYTYHFAVKERLLKTLCIGNTDLDINWFMCTPVWMKEIGKYLNRTCQSNKLNKNVHSRCRIQIVPTYTNFRFYFKKLTYSSWRQLSGSNSIPRKQFNLEVKGFTGEGRK